MNQTDYLPRGFRNKNPLNLRRSANKWLGKIEPGTDPEFEQFVSIEMGIRAALVNARTIMRRLRTPTVMKLIQTWAPPSENNTMAYVHRVCESARLLPNERIDFKKKTQMCSIFYAMIIVECGRAVPIKTIEDAYNMI